MATKYLNYGIKEVLKPTQKAVNVYHDVLR